MTIRTPGHRSRTALANEKSLPGYTPSALAKSSSARLMALGAGRLDELVLEQRVFVDIAFARLGIVNWKA